MKISRARKVHRTLSFFSNTFGFRQPYQILVDGTLCFAALKEKINLQEQLPKYFGAEVKLLTTQCVILETENLGPALYGAMLITKQFRVHRCGHENNRVSGSACLLSMLGKKNKNRYIIATQDRDLQDKVRRIPGAPLLFLYQKAPILETPSPASLNTSERLNEAKFKPDRQPGESVSEVKRRILGEEEKKQERKHRPKRLKGPNPLSCKKKKKKTNKNGAVQVSKVDKKQRRSRKKVKIPQHVKEHLQAIA